MPTSRSNVTRATSATSASHPSGTIDVVLAVHTLDDVDDLGRILRQVHRVLKPGAPFVLVLDHPFAAVGPTPDGKVRRYGEDRRTVGELLAALDRSNFRVESFDELGVSGESAVPTTLGDQGPQARFVARPVSPIWGRIVADVDTDLPRIDE